MPLKRSCSVAAFQANIASEIKSGKPRDQAVAIAADTLRTACSEAGKPLPAGSIKQIESVEKKAPLKRKRTREYLEGALQRARAVLSARDFATIFQASRASAGGQVAARNRRDRLTALERMAVEKAKPSDMTNDELRSAMHKLNRRMAASRRMGGTESKSSSAAKPIIAEMHRRKIEPKSGATQKEPTSSDVSVPVPLGNRQRGRKPLKRREAVKVVKGFVNGEPEGGAHTHGLDRINAKTFSDGPHLHLFAVPGTGELLFTFEDGAHAHNIEEGGNATSKDGVHSHKVTLPSGQIAETKLGGNHLHGLMVETADFGGLHTHDLRLPDGTEIKSLSSGEFVERFTDGNVRSVPIFSSSAITNALHEVQELRDQVASILRPGLGEVIEMAAAGKEVDTGLTTHAEVIETFDDVLDLQLDGGEPFEMARGVLKDADVEPGDLIEVRSDEDASTIIGFSKSVQPTHIDEVHAWAVWRDVVKSHATPVPFIGPEDARLMFVASSPSQLEVLRSEALVGPDAATFEASYLKPLGLTKAQIAIGFAIPVHAEAPTADLATPWRDHFVAAMKRFTKARIVTLGRVAKESLEGVAHYSLPHPAALRRNRDHGEVARKLKSIRKGLDATPPVVEHTPTSKPGPCHGNHRGTLAETISELRKAGSIRTAVIKSDEEKQIVYGAVLDPYEVDLQEDWTPPAEIEATAHDFMEKSRVVGFRHRQKAEGAQVVESFVELYPPGQHELALKNLPHKAYRRKFGNDTIHSGTWVAGVKLPDDLWAMHKKGELDAFSIGGFSFKTQVSEAAMPDVTFIDLVERPAT